VFAKYENEDWELLLQLFVENSDEFQFQADVNQELHCTDENKN
jgi:hypothetical protein